ncbi:MAG TPA: energy transducer TonB [Bacteroidales bacterium]|nr:energy transducer TonB [Bacteroidales bacterium]
MMNRIISFKKFMFLTATMFLVFTGSGIAQTLSGDFRTLEQLEDRSEDIYMKIYSILSDYPDFSYKYVYNNGKITDVEINGVENQVVKSRLKVLLYDLKKNKKAMLGLPSRTGIYYSVDKEPEPKNGYRAFYEQLNNNLVYPQDAKDAGVEGTVYVKFVVNANGEIPYAVGSEDIKSPFDNYVNDMKKEAVKAVKATSGDWQPGMVNGVAVSTWVVIPVYFNFKKNPTLPALIR